MEFLEMAKNRYSERYFDSRPIEQEKLDRILEVGRQAPTACNYQPQRFYLIRSEEAKAKLRTVTHFHFNAPLVILVCYDIDTVWKNPRDRYYDVYNSGEQDASIAATMMMFEAEEQGIHSVWVRGFDSRSVVETFGLPKNMVPVMMMPMGYPRMDSKPSDWHYIRKPVSEFVEEL
jgi:nitroreductase